MIIPLRAGEAELWCAFARHHDTPELWHQYNWRRSVFYKALVEYIAEVLVILEARDRHGSFEPYYFQIEPNLRIQPPGETAVTWHSDAEYGHLAQEWNVWVPLMHLTDDSQRLWVDDTPAGPHPIDVPFGSAYIFPGAQWRHGNRPNETEVTRCSMDFRLIAQKDFVDHDVTTVRYGVKLSLGDYWREP
jgi:hypothetical protein